MTSVKEFRIDEAATDDELGRGSFVFTDAYSVFDWGQMPDSIPEKGASLCTMGAFNFERLESEGVPTHYRGVVEHSSTDRRTRSDDVVENGDVVPLEDASSPPWEMAIDLTQVPDLPHEGREYDYDHYHEAAGENYLIPLEVVFRNRVPVGSSLRRRTDPDDHGLAFDSWPEEAVDLEEPIVEFSTKYEEGDRYLDRAEADEISGIASIDDLESVALEVNRIITEQADSAGLVHEDGKIECLYYQGEIRVADVVGTFDENRFSYEGTQLSKEVLRQYHKRTQPDWVQAVEAAKAEAKREDIADWKSLCDVEPEPLEDDVIETARDLYCAGANAYMDMELFDAPPLSSAIGAVQRL
ncbi:phosphoribosylaminoimidazolesuccinocarboxamide synthase [Natronorubrum sulfidifaciens]|uniref:Phosphoribosylaminoimidazole-succinocarboxamide synthase n=1 Tax=Natronorubrum sulfidifaciens JCM 14089 TaxID=1230460 RepID=L9W7B8_9EURY|nr:phosphoribosylaminoimidazolesuccinocarboxamide synthase [Natronorubrum sulfidifaciens]ELY44228.1 phosphoribosylaminoimidazole-succinocarboxamide synthase [Natronorubrum sulfidifaciens JCM 14089]